MENLQEKIEPNQTIKLLQSSITSLRNKHEHFSRQDTHIRAQMVEAGFGNRPDLDVQHRNNAELIKVIEEQIRQKELQLEEELRKN